MIEILKNNEDAVAIFNEYTRLFNYHKWYPISELHEDFGPCVLLNINDPTCMQIKSNLDLDFIESEWTHFCRIPLIASIEGI